MPKKKPRTVEEHLEVIEILLAGVLLDRKPSVKQVAKIIGIDNAKLGGLLPDSHGKTEPEET